MSTWQQVLLGAGALLLVMFFWPGVKAVMEQSRQAEERDWPAVLVPVAAVILFVVVLVAVACS